jgi:hypothetical protein
MKCPHCLVQYQSVASTTQQPLTASEESGRITFVVSDENCPSCGKAVIHLVQNLDGRAYKRWVVYPKGYVRSLFPSEVPEKLVGEYREACLVLADSPKASAALSRRCLQQVLRDHGGTTKKDLFDQLAEVRSKVPTYFGDMLHHIRVYGCALSLMLAAS